MSISPSIPENPKTQYPGGFRLMDHVDMYPPSVQPLRRPRSFVHFDWITTDVILALVDRGWYVVADGRVHL